MFAVLIDSCSAMLVLVLVLLVVRVGAWVV
jgi:hypothetical protein